jgi:O-antigen/teichoic acid export membrane protein
MMRSIFSNYAGMLISTVVSFLMTPILIHGLGDFHYGMWVLVATLVDYYGLLDLGVRFTLQRYVARSKGANEREALNGTSVSALVIALGMMAIIIPSIVGLARFLPRLFQVPGPEQALFVRVLIVLGIGFAVSLPAKVLGAYLCGLQRFDLYNVAGSGNTIVQAILLVFVLHRGYGIEGCAVVNLGTAVLSLAVHVWMVRWADPEVSFDLRRARWSEIRELLNFGFYIFLNQVGDVFRFRLDSLVIASWLSIALVTPFNVAARLIEYFRYIIAAITGPLITEMSTLHGQAQENKLRRLFLRSTKMTALVCLPVGILLCVDGKALIRLWVGQGFATSSFAVLVILAIGRTASAIQTPSMALLLARGRKKALGWWSLSEGVANLALSIYWAPKYGIVGVALGTMVPMIVVKALLQPWYTLWLGKISWRDYFVESMARPLAVSAVYVVVAEGLLSIFHRSGLLPFLLASALQLLAYAALVYLLGLTSGERGQMKARVLKLGFATGLVHPA